MLRFSILCEPFFCLFYLLKYNKPNLGTPILDANLDAIFSLTLPLRHQVSYPLIRSVND
jgi:hypothetical protein